MGNDYVWRGAQGWVASKQLSEDPAIRRGALEPRQVQALVRQTYRVLLTRGIRGTFVFSTDAETRGLLRSIVDARPWGAIQ